MMDFSASAGAASQFDTIPEGQLAWAILNVRGLKSSNSGGEYLDCELTIDEGQPYAGRKLWEMIGNPFHQGNSEKYRQMGMLAITRILEAGKNASPNNPQGYQLGDFTQLSGLRVAVKIGVEAGTDGHADKNRVKEWLTPNPASQSGYKHFETLQKGIYNASTKPATAAGGFAGNGFGATPTNTPAAPSAGFGNGGQPAATAPFGASSPVAAPSSPSTGFTAQPAMSPSNGGPGWLAQANGQ